MPPSDGNACPLECGWPLDDHLPGEPCPPSCPNGHPGCDHTSCPDGWHWGDELPCNCTPDCMLEDDDGEVRDVETVVVDRALL